jgi:sugar phosphate isomerase/epimerase
MMSLVPVFLALSCFQSRTQDAALDELLPLHADGIQLTPGCLPSPGFRERVEREVKDVRVHHGFAWDAYRAEAWTPDGRPALQGRDRSVHPPRGVATAVVIEAALRHDVLVETMYPGEALGTGDEIDAALDAGIRLAVDTSHLFIQRTAGVLSDRTLRRLFASHLVEEVHVSDNDGRRDLHREIGPETFLLPWARERVAELPVVIESYWHRTERGERARQVDRLRA